MTALIVTIVVGAVAVVGLRRRRHTAEQSRLDESLPELVHRLARSVRAGETVRSALVDAGRAADGPLGRELGPVARSLERGSSLRDALSDWRDAAERPGIDMVVRTCVLAQESGGSAAAALDGLASTLLDGLEVRAEARALVTQATTSMWVMIGLPPLGALVFAMIDPRVAHVLTSTTSGRLCLLVGLALDGAGAWVGSVLVRRSVA